MSCFGLRRGDLHHVACWIYSPPSGDAIGVVGRIYLSGLLAVKDWDKSEDHQVDPYHVVSDFWVAHSEVVLIDLI